MEENLNRGEGDKIERDDNGVDISIPNQTIPPATYPSATQFRCEECQRGFGTEEALGMHNSAKHKAFKEPPKNNFNTVLTILGVIAIVFLAGYFIYFNDNLIKNNSITGAVVLPEDSGDGVQKITLSLKNFNYYPNSITVKAGTPVEITLDKSIGGCFRSFNIKDLGVRAYSSNPNEKIKFTPAKKGAFEFACGMRMGIGTINVV